MYQLFTGVESPYFTRLDAFEAASRRRYESRSSSPPPSSPRAVDFGRAARQLLASEATPTIELPILKLLGELLLDRIPVGDDAVHCGRRRAPEDGDDPRPREGSSIQYEAFARLQDLRRRPSQGRRRARGAAAQPPELLVRMATFQSAARRRAVPRLERLVSHRCSSRRYREIPPAAPDAAAAAAPIAAVATAALVATAAATELVAPPAAFMAAAAPVSRAAAALRPRLPRIGRRGGVRDGVGQATHSPSAVAAPPARLRFDARECRRRRGPARLRGRRPPRRTALYRRNGCTIRGWSTRSGGRRRPRASCVKASRLSVRDRRRTAPRPSVPLLSAAANDELAALVSLCAAARSCGVLPLLVGQIDAADIGGASARWRRRVSIVRRRGRALATRRARAVLRHRRPGRGTSSIHRGALRARRRPARRAVAAA